MNILSISLRRRRRAGPRSSVTARRSTLQGKTAASGMPRHPARRHRRDGVRAAYGRLACSTCASTIATLTRNPSTSDRCVRRTRTYVGTTMPQHAREHRSIPLHRGEARRRRHALGFEHQRRHPALDGRLGGTARSSVAASRARADTRRTDPRGAAGSAGASRAMRVRAAHRAATRRDTRRAGRRRAKRCGRRRESGDGIRARSEQQRQASRCE